MTCVRICGKVVMISSFVEINNNMLLTAETDVDMAYAQSNA